MDTMEPTKIVLIECVLIFQVSLCTYVQKGYSGDLTKSVDYVCMCPHFHVSTLTGFAVVNNF